MSLMKQKKNLKKNQVVWIFITQVLEVRKGTFHNVFMDSLNLDDDTIVYFLENDYIHAPNSMGAYLMDLILEHYVTLYDHPINTYHLMITENLQE